MKTILSGITYVNNTICYPSYLYRKVYEHCGLRCNLCNVLDEYCKCEKSNNEDILRERLLEFETN